jgi:hypothetical protein
MNQSQQWPGTEIPDASTIIAHAIAHPMRSYQCLNGPCEGRGVEAPSDATPGTACAIPWKTPRSEERFAVYLLVDHNGHQGLMYIQSYSKPDYAQAKVQRVTALCLSLMS